MLAIRNFGHFWSRLVIDWNRSGKNGDLSGYVMQNYHPRETNFCNQIAVYALFTSTREPIYVGQSGGRQDQRLFQRLKNHTRSGLRDRWQYFSWFGLRDVNSSGRLSDYQKPESTCKGTNAVALNEVEAVLLQILEPRLNKQGPRWGSETTEYFQYVPSEWKAPVETAEMERIGAISEKLDELFRLTKNRSK